MAEKMLVLVLCLFIAMSTGCPGRTPGFIEYDEVISGVDYDIPATICLPDAEGTYPAVVMLHGSGSSRNESHNAYMRAAEKLASDYGIASIRIDFAGYGDSTADPLMYCYTSAVADAVAAAGYMKTLGSVDADSVGIMGWSQGGAVALLSAARNPSLFAAAATWSGAPDMSIADFFDDAAYEQAKETGSFDFVLWNGGSIPISLKWCEEVLGTDVLSEFSGYPGPVLAIAGTADTLVDPAWSEKIVGCSGNADSEAWFIEEADHTLNVLSESDFHTLDLAIERTGAFFAKELKG